MNPSMTLQRDQAPWYKQFWPWFLIAGPAIVIVAGMVTAWYAVTTNNDLVSDDYYKQGLAVNQELQRDHQASALGLQGDLLRSQGNLRLMLSASDQAALPKTVVLNLAHPTRASLDQTVSMTAAGAGVYDGQLRAELIGKWLVTLEDPDGQWRLQGKWRTDSEEPLRLRALAAK